MAEVVPGAKKVLWEFGPGVECGVFWGKQCNSEEERLNAAFIYSLSKLGRGWPVAQVAECLPSIHRALDLIPWSRTWRYRPEYQILLGEGSRSSTGSSLGTPEMRGHCGLHFVPPPQKKKVNRKEKNLGHPKSGQPSGCLAPGLSLVCDPSRVHYSPSPLPRPTLESCSTPRPRLPAF